MAGVKRTATGSVAKFENMGLLGAWISYSNEKRPHLSHGLLTPTEAYDILNQYLNAAA